MNCPNCNKEEFNGLRCINCGYRFHEKRCPNCGSGSAMYFQELEPAHNGFFVIDTCKSCNLNRKSYHAERRKFQLNDAPSRRTEDADRLWKDI